MAWVLVSRTRLECNAAPDTRDRHVRPRRVDICGFEHTNTRSKRVAESQGTLNSAPCPVSWHVSYTDSSHDRPCERGAWPSIQCDSRVTLGRSAGLPGALATFADGPRQ